MKIDDELQSLLGLFPDESRLIERAVHVSQSMLPKPYQQMLAHNEHMTLHMEQYHQTSVDVRVLARRLDGDIYSRKIVLLKHGSDEVVQFGIVRFDLTTVSQRVREEILSEQTPLGRILIRHNVFRDIQLGALLRITAGPGLSELFRMPLGGETYGRLATIFCEDQAAVDLLEISAPLNL